MPVRIGREVQALPRKAGLGPHAPAKCGKFVFKRDGVPGSGHVIAAIAAYQRTVRFDLGWL
jgi:hypothetical protein